MSNSFQTQQNPNLVSHQPPDPQNVPFRPLNKGMILSFSSMVIPNEACKRAENFIIDERGPRRRSGYVDYAQEEAAEFDIVDSMTYWDTEGQQRSLLLTKGPLYQVGFGTGLDRIKWGIEGNGDISGNTLSDSSADFADAGALAGDYVKAEGQLHEIGAVSTTSVTIIGTWDEAKNGIDYEIIFAFRADRLFQPDWTIINNELVITDFKRPLQVFVPGVGADQTVEDYIDDDTFYPPGAHRFLASAIETFLDRLWVGHTEEDEDGDRRQRIRWSRSTNPRDFSPDINYIDLPYTSGEIMRIVRFQDGLAVYTRDAIFIGTRTNNPELPLAFRQIDTGGVGLVGPHAITPWLDGHFFVGQDDLYFLGNEGPQRIGSPIIKESLEQSAFLDLVYVQPDPANERVIFGFPVSKPRMERLWSFNYKSNAWSYDTIETSFIANPDVNFRLQWVDLTGTWETLENAYPTWEDMDQDEIQRTLYFERNNVLKRYAQGSIDDAGTPIKAVFESKDYDFDQPDQNKTWLRLGVKIDYDRELGAPLNFKVEISANRGRRWTDAGILRIPAGEDEGFVNFLLTSSTLRFRLTSTSQVRPYWIAEVVLRARARGREITPGTQSNVPNTQS